MERKKTILISIGHFTPGNKIGGPLISISNIIENLSPYYKFKVVTSDRDFKEHQPYPGIITNQWIKKDQYEIIYLKRDYFILFRLLFFLKKNNFDIVYLNPLWDPVFSFFIVLSNKIGAIKINKIIVAPRGELFDEAINFKPLKKTFFLWFINFWDIYTDVYWHATSLEEKNAVIKKIKLSKEKVRVASVMSNAGIIDNTINPKTIHNSHELRIIYLARISKDKNLEFAFDVLKHIKTQVHFDIYGPIEDEYIWSNCLKKIEALPDYIKVKYAGVALKKDVTNLLSTYDLFFLPTFAENFGHSIAEALSVGTPVLISDNTPWRNLEENDLGWDINLNEIDKFVNAIENMSKLSTEDKNKMRQKRKILSKKILNNPQTLIDNINLFKF